MRHLTSAMLLVAAVIHLLPLAGLAGSARLSQLYGLSFEEPNLEILMRHRAVLFGLLGALLAVSAFRRSLRPVAFVGGLVSDVSFLALAWGADGYNAQVARVVDADVLALACLVVGLLTSLRSREAAARADGAPSP